MIDPGHPPADEPVQAGIEILGKLKGISTTEVDWNTKVAYDITIRTFNPAALSLGTLKAGTILNVKVAPTNEPQAANTKKERK